MSAAAKWPLSNRENRLLGDNPDLLGTPDRDHSLTSEPRSAPVTKGGRGPAIKGGRVEREIVKLHRVIGVRAERVPLSGAARYQGNGEDVDIYICGEDSAPAVCQVKAVGRSSDRTKTVRGWLGDADALFVRLDAESGERARPPLVVLAWRTWERLLKGGKK